MILQPRFYRRVAINAVRTFAQAALAVLGGSAINIWHIDAKTAAGVGLGAALISVLMAADRVEAMPPKDDADARVDEIFDRPPVPKPIEPPSAPTHYEQLPNHYEQIYREHQFDGLPTAYPSVR